MAGYIETVKTIDTILWKMGYKDGQDYKWSDRDRVLTFKSDDVRKEVAAKIPAKMIRAQYPRTIELEDKGLKDSLFDSALKKFKDFIEKEFNPPRFNIDISPSASNILKDPGYISAIREIKRFYPNSEVVNVKRVAYSYNALVNDWKGLSCINEHLVIVIDNVGKGLNSDAEKIRSIFESKGFDRHHKISWESNGIPWKYKDVVPYKILKSSSHYSEGLKGAVEVILNYYSDDFVAVHPESSQEMEILKNLIKKYNLKSRKDPFFGSGSTFVFFSDLDVSRRFRNDFNLEVEKMNKFKDRLFEVKDSFGRKFIISAKTFDSALKKVKDMKLTDSDKLVKLAEEFVMKGSILSGIVHGSIRVSGDGALGRKIDEFYRIFTQLIQQLKSESSKKTVSTSYNGDNQTERFLARGRELLNSLSFALTHPDDGWFESKFGDYTSTGRKFEQMSKILLTSAVNYINGINGR